MRLKRLAITVYVAVSIAFGAHIVSAGSFGSAQGGGGSSQGGGGSGGGSGSQDLNGVLGVANDTRGKNIKITTGDLVQFGGTTSSFSALKGAGAYVEVRAADDSGYHSLNMSSLQWGTGLRSTLSAAGALFATDGTFSGGIAVGAATPAANSLVFGSGGLANTIQLRGPTDLTFLIGSPDAAGDANDVQIQAGNDTADNFNGAYVDVLGGSSTLGGSVSIQAGGKNAGPSGAGIIVNGGSATTGGYVAITGQYYSAQHTTTTTLDWNDGNCQSITLASGAQTFTFANPKAGGRYLLKLKQPAGGGAGTVTLPGSVHYSGGTTPTLTTTNSQVDIFTFYFDGTTYYAAVDLNFAP